MSSPSFKPGLIASEQFQETTVTNEELCRACDLLNGVENPLTGFEIHLLEALRNECPAVTPKEEAIVSAMAGRRGEFSGSQGHYNHTYLSPYEQAENDAILEEMWGDVDASSRSDEAGWLYED
jgi:hypothetical protein